MAGIEEVPNPSYETALALLPPVYYYGRLNHLRSLYDKAFAKWPPHINLLYPFVSPERLTAVVEELRGLLQKQEQFLLSLTEVGVFTQRNYATIWLGPGNNADLDSLVQTLGSVEPKGRKVPYKAHLTVGQTSKEATAIEILKNKASKFVGNISWEVDRIAVLKRTSKGDMQVVDEILFGTVETLELAHNEDEADEELSLAIANTSLDKTEVTKQTTYCFARESGTWDIFHGLDYAAFTKAPGHTEILVSTYNVMTDQPYPPPVERYPVLLRAILEAQVPSKPSVICLQEVTDEFLEFLLLNEEFRSRFPFSTHTSQSALQSLRNIVVFANAASGGFTWEILPFKARHKSAPILSFPNVTVAGRSGEAELPLVLASIHLSAGLKDSAISSRNSQMKALIAHLSSNYPDNPWVIAGDTNIGTSKVALDNAVKHGIVSAESCRTQEKIIDGSILIDVWPDVYPGDQEDVAYDGMFYTFGSRRRGEYGATFDPLTNPLAAEKMRVARDLRPQRYDRILIKRHFEIGNPGSGKVFHINAVSRFGFPEGDGPVGSDHWGLTATLKILEPVEEEVCPEVQWDDLPQHLTEAEITKTLHANDMLPSTRDMQLRQAVMQSVRECLLSNPSEEDKERYPPETWSRMSFGLLRVEPVGSLGMGLSDKKSDVDIICVGEVSQSAFYKIVGWRIRHLGKEFDVNLSRYVEGAAVGMMELVVKGVLVDLHYSQAPKLAERWNEVAHLPPDDIIFALPYTTRRKINAFRDMLYLKATIPNYPIFRLAYRALKLWSKRRGIYSSRFGYLGGVHLTYLLSRVAKLLATQSENFTVCELLGAFLEEYARFDWEDQEVVDPNFAHIPRKRKSNEPLVILTANVPQINITANATKHSVYVLNKELNRARDMLWDGKTWAQICGVEQDNVEEFLSSYKNFIKVDVQFWGNSKGRGRNLVGWVESRIVLLLVDLQINIPSLRLHAYPRRFTDISSQEELRAFYLIGCHNTMSITDPQLKQIQSTKFQMALQRFNDKLQANKMIYFESDCFTGVSHVKASSKTFIEGVEGAPVLDNDDTWNFFGDAESLGEEGNIGEMLDIAEEAEDERLVDEEYRLSSVSPEAGAKDKRRNRLRPSHDVLFRLRWDPNLDDKEYTIGYEDRFIGIREMSANMWDGDRTSESFVPMHRIVYFKHKESGEVVWDRRNNVDKVFGSGGVVEYKEGEEE